MDIRLIKNKNIWEKFVQGQDYTSPFQSWNWVLFERSLGNRFETLGIYEGGELVGILPLKHVIARRGRYLHLRHSPIFDFENDKLWEVSLDHLKNKAKEEGYSFIRLSPLIKQDNELKFADIFSHLKDSPMHDVDGEITWVLNLKQSENEIFSNMRKNTRYYIKRAERDGVEVIKTQEPKSLEYFWEIYQDTVKRQKWQAYSYEYIKKEFEAFVGDDAIAIYLAKYKGKYIAGSLILYYGNQAIYHHSGHLSKFRKIPASYLIQWEAIKEARERGLSWYNLWGISPLVMEGGEFKAESGHPWEGLTFFKLGFGGEVRQFIHAKDFPINKWRYNLTRSFEVFERLGRGY